MSLRHEAFAAVRWTTLAMIGRAAVQFGQVLILARLLNAADFAAMAMVVSVVAIAAILTDLGVSNAIIHFQDISQSERSALFWLNVSAGLVLTLATTLSASLLAGFYGEARLKYLLPIASLTFVLLAAGQQLRVVAQKELRFGGLAVIEVASAFAGALTSITLAFAGLGVLSVAIGSVVAATANSALAWGVLAQGWRPDRQIDLRPARRFLSYGLDTIGVGLLNALNMQSDVIVGGRMLAHAALGHYTLPRDLCLRLMLIVNPIVTRVGLPMIARAQGEEARIRQVFRQTMRMTASINFPIYAGMSLFAPEIVHVLFGPVWAPAAPVLRVAALAALLRSIGNPLGSLLFALGRTRIALMTAIGVTATIFPALSFGAHYGVLGLAWANLGFFGAQIAPLWWIGVRSSCRMGFLDYHKQLAIPALTTLTATAVAYFATVSVNGDWPRLVLGGVSGGTAYLAASYFLNRSWLLSTWELATVRLPWRRPAARSAAQALEEST